MALTSGGSVSPNQSAQNVSPQGATRRGRLDATAVEAAGRGVPGSQAPSEAFIDGNSLPRLDNDNRPDMHQAAQINDAGVGFPGLGDTGYNDIPGNPGGVGQSNSKSANVVSRDVRVSGGQQSPGDVAAPTSENYSHGSSDGFPFQVPPARKL